MDYESPPFIHSLIYFHLVILGDLISREPNSSPNIKYRMKLF